MGMFVVLQEQVMTLWAASDETITSVKAIAAKQCLAIGDGNGWVHVYPYTTNGDIGWFGDMINRFEAHSGGSIQALAVHPSEPFLLTKSSLGGPIKLWDWSKGWKCSQIFDNQSGKVNGLLWNPSETKTFATVSSDEVEVSWPLHFLNIDWVDWGSWL